MANDPLLVNTALNLGRPLRLTCARSAALADIENVMRTVLDLDKLPARQTAGPTLFGRLFQAIGLSLSKQWLWLLRNSFECSTWKTIRCSRR